MDCYEEQIQKAKHHKYLYHNTSIESLSFILKNRSLKLSRLDKVNDADENKRITSPWNKRVFVACFSHEKHSEKYFFENYGIVRLAFKREKVNVGNVYFDSELKKPVPVYNISICCKDLSWGVYNNIIADIKYVDNFDDYILPDGTESNAGLIKMVSGYDNYKNFRNWIEEYETRARVSIRPFGREFFTVGLNKYQYYIPEFNSLFMELPEIEEIKVFPKVAKEEYNKLLDLLKIYKLDSKLML